MIHQVNKKCDVSIKCKQKDNTTPEGHGLMARDYFTS